MSLTMLPLAASVTSLALAVFCMAQRPRTRLNWTLAAGLVSLAIEAALGYVLVRTETYETRRFWLQVVQAAGVVLPLPWGLFILAVARARAVDTVARWRVAVGVVTVLAAGLGVAAFHYPGLLVADVQGDFHAARLDGVGASWIAFQLFSTVGILSGLEIVLRGASTGSRWRIKYLVVGAGAVFLARFYFSSQILLFHVILASYLTTQAATLLVGNVLIMMALVRSRVRDVDFTVSQRVIYHSVLCGALGLYLVVVSVVGWLLNGLGITEELFWGSLVAFLAAIAVVVPILSDDVRWRIRRFISLNFYRSKYDYRQEWIGFTKRLASHVSVDEVAAHLVAAIGDAVGTRRAVLFLLDARHANYRRVAGIGLDRSFSLLGTDNAFVGSLRAEREPIVLDKQTPASNTFFSAFADAAVAVPLSWRDSLIGFVLVGPERTGALYTAEDLQFLATIGEQAAGVLQTAQLSETLAQSREFEAFHRLTSFVIHDMKNAISALSLLSENALANFDDPEFQRDAVRTLSRTVERMNGLLRRLSSAPDAGPLHLSPVDLVDLIAEATRVVTASPRIKLVIEREELPHVRLDGDAILRVLQNLIKNALDALDGDGTLTVKLYSESPDVVVSISDTGSGMSEEFLSKSLFTPFRSTKKGGWGIGLYQAKSIVESHGGRIVVESKQGEGTTFWLRLPATPTGVVR